MAVMTKVYDLHAHSTASDGTLTPSQLVQRASDFGVDVLALTDHDSTAGLCEAREKAGELDIRLISGAEISVTWNRQTVHIVALGIDENNEQLKRGLANLVEFRDWRAQEIGRKLEKSGIPGAFEGAKKLSNGDLISRTHFARFLVNTGKVKTFRDVFRHFLVSGKPGHVSGQWGSLEEVLGWIQGAGGQAVIAHPARYKMTRSKLRRLIGEFSELDGAGIEVLSSSHSKDEGYAMAGHARDFGLLASVGSDFHSPETPWTVLGRLGNLPVGSRPIWHDWTEA
jgi:predicted metal-dependent phosphoesterase TrpH